MADDPQFEPLSQFMTPQSLMLLRLQQRQAALEQAGQQSGVNYAARVGGMSLADALTGGPMAAHNGPLDQIAANNQDMVDASGVAQPAQAAPGLPGLEIQARRYEALASMLAHNGQPGVAASMQDKANILRKQQADMDKTRSESFEATQKGLQAIAEGNKANRFSVWKRDPDQSDVAPNKTRYVDQNGYAEPKVVDQGNLPDYTTTDVIVPGGTQTALYDKHNGRLIMQPGVRPYYGQVNMDVAKDLQKRISTINQARVAMANADPYINDAVGLQAVAAQHGGNIVNLFTKGSANPASTRAIAQVDAANQLSRAALRVTGRYSNAQDKDISELLPEVEGIGRNPQHERTKLWGTEAQLAGEEAILRQNYGQIMGNDTRALPPSLPTLEQRDLARRQQQGAQQAPAAAPQAAPPVPVQQAGFAPAEGQGPDSATPDNPRGARGRPPNPPPQASDNEPAVERRSVKLKDGRTVNYVVH